MSEIKTKEDLTKYLNIKLYEVFQNVTFAVSYEFNSVSNISDNDARLWDHCHEEADTCIVLHSLDVTKRNPFTDLTVYCCDADALPLFFIILMSYAVVQFFVQQIVTFVFGHYIVILVLSFARQTGKLARFTKKTC